MKKLFFLLAMSLASMQAFQDPTGCLVICFPEIPGTCYCLPDPPPRTPPPAPTPTPNPRSCQDCISK